MIMSSQACNLPLATAPSVCRHCSRPIPLRSRSAFCCQGCETVFGLIQGAGLGRYYSILEGTGDHAPTGAAVPLSSHYDWLDHPDTRRDYETAEGIRFYLEGVHCAACVWLVEKLPQLVEGILSARLDLGSAVVTVQSAPEGHYAAAALQLERLGYRPHPVRQSESDELARKEDRTLLIRLGIAAAAAGNIMLLSVALYAGADGEFAKWFSWISFLLSIPVLFYSAAPFYHSSLGSLRSRQLSIDVPVALGLQVTFWVSTINLFRGDARIYFDSVTTLVFLLLSTRYLLRRVQRTSLSASSLAHFLMPATARRRLADGDYETVSLESLELGDAVEVLPGDLFPADGVVLQGSGRIHRALLTGESRPESVAAGAEVFGGTQNLESPLIVQVTATGQSSRVGAILQSMQASLQSRAPIVAFSDRVSQGFIAATLILIPLVFFGNGIFSDESGWSGALQRALALALVTCPCAFALATPLSFASTLGKAARAGILIKGADVLERLSRVRKVCFDKTGTLTEGRFQVLDWKFLPEKTVLTDEEAATLIVAIEKHSRHPIARALCEHFQHPLCPPEDAKGFTVTKTEERAGIGISARYRDRQYSLRAARRDGATEQDEALTTRVALFEEDREIGVVTLGDRLRPEASQANRQLAELNVETHLLSGDSAAAVGAVARVVGIPESRARHQLSPEGKKEYLKAQSKQDEVMMVGDGANDAPALASASVGVAIHGGLEASIRASDVYLSRPGLLQAPRLIIIGRETLRVVKRNFAVSLAYNAIAASAAILGKIDPLLAAVLMPASALAVIASASIGTRRLRDALREVTP